MIIFQKNTGSMYREFRRKQLRKLKKERELQEEI